MAEIMRMMHGASVQGHSRAQLHLARLFMSGEGAPQSHSMAIMWICRAAEHGDLPAQFDLAVIHMNGIEGMKQDLVEAASWCR